MIALADGTPIRRRMRAAIGFDGDFFRSGTEIVCVRGGRYMNAYPQNLELVEFINIFRERYVVDAADGFRVVVMTNDELLWLSKYLYSGIMDWKVAPMNGTRESSDLGKSLERFASRNAVETGLDVIATEEELRALGVFLVRGLAEIFSVLESTDERTYCC